MTTTTRAPADARWAITVDGERRTFKMYDVAAAHAAPGTRPTLVWGEGSNHG